MADKTIQEINNTRTSVLSGDQFVIGGADGFTYKADLTILRGYLLESSLTASTTKGVQSAVVKTAIDAINATLTTDNTSFDDFQKITDALEDIQTTLTVDDAAYDTLQEIADNLKAAQTKLATIEDGAEVNVQADWNESNNTNDAFINNKPALGTASAKDVGTAIGDMQENGAALGNSETVETDATGKFITAAKNTAYNKDFGTSSGQVAEGDASYLKAETYTKTEANALLSVKQDTSNKGQANGYAGLDSNAQVPLSQLPAKAQGSKVVADIAARDVIASADRYEGLPVHVLNATADTTVTSGSAGYILKSGLANTDWEKTYESESLDIDLSDAAIKTAYENNLDTNAFTDSEKANLANQSGTNTGDETLISIQTKRPLKTIEGQSLEGSGNIDLAKADVGLDNVDNTSDLDKPVSTAQQTALDGKLAKASNLSDVNDRQTAIDNLTDASNASNEEVLTKDTATGNAIFKPIPSLQALLPTGTIVMSIASSLTGALKFDGVSGYSKTQYSSLYSIINNLAGTAFDINEFDFYLPDPSGRVLGVAGSGAGLTTRLLFLSVGAETHTLLVNEMPSHDHPFEDAYYAENRGFGGSFTGSTTAVDSDNDLFTRNTTTSNSGGGQPHNNMQPTIFAAQNLFIYF